MSRQMISVRFSSLAGRSVVLVCLCGIQAIFADDDPDIFIHSTQNQGSAVKYVWAVKKSRLAALPHWDPVTAEAPISPHQAVTAAIEFVRDRCGASAHLRVSDIALYKRGLELNSVAPDVWTYTVSFDCDPEPPAGYRELLNVDVLLDGKVVVPVEKPEKPPE
jgi:hypothetical protein